MGLADWLKLFRAQTAPATVFSILVPYLIAGGRDLITIMAIFVLGTIAHFFSFGHNSLMDYWYDVKDPNKKHHPLESGEIKFETAHKVIHYGMVLTCLGFVALTYYVSPSPVLALMSLIGYIVFGHAYNDGLDKNTSHSWISISLCFTSLALYGWFLGTGEVNAITVLIAVWAFLTIVYQIAWEGNLKDLWNPAEKHNLLRTWVEYDWSGTPIKFTSKAVSFGFMAIRLGWNTVILGMIAYYLNAGLMNWIMYVAFTFIETLAVIDIHDTAEHSLWSRDVLLERFGVAEAVEFFRLIAISLQPAIVLTLVSYGLLYFVLMNRLLWGSKFGPKV